MLAALIPLLAPVVEGLVGLIPDEKAREEAKAKAMADILAAAMKADSEQVEVNKVEAANSNLFVAGWRPFIGWVCGSSLAWAWIIAPLAQWVVAFWHPEVKLPSIPVDQQLELILAMLGMGGLRTFEKLKKVAK